MSLSIADEQDFETLRVLVHQMNALDDARQRRAMCAMLGIQASNPPWLSVIGNFWVDTEAMDFKYVHDSRWYYTFAAFERWFYATLQARQRAN